MTGSVVGAVDDYGSIAASRNGVSVRENTVED